MTNRTTFIEYHGCLAMNRQVFFLNHGKLIKAYNDIHAALEMLPIRFCVQRDVRGKTMVSFIPFIALMSRQTLVGFDHLVSHQAYQAWVAVRPAVEIPLMIGKWIDDPTSAKIWLNRDADPKTYSKVFGSGKAMLSESLRRGCDILRVLKVLNDKFLHPNPYYYYRHLDLASAGNGKVNIQADYFDEQSTIESHALAFLHLSSLLHDALQETFSNVLGDTYGTTTLIPGIRASFGECVQQLRKDDRIADSLFTDLGCWPREGGQS